MQTSKKDITVKSFLVFILISVSTLPLFKQNFGIYLLFGSVLFTLKELRIHKEMLFFAFAAFAIELFHNFYFDIYDIAITRQALITIISSMLLIYYIKLDFLPIYINILYYFSLISFVFFVLYYADSHLVGQFAKAVPGIFVKTSVFYGTEINQINPIFYTFDNNFLELGRNNGPFWEPTVFATMLVIAQIFNFLLNKTFFNKKGIVFTIALLTTFSTTGFMAYFLLIIFYFLLSDRIKTFTKVIVLTGFIGLGVTVFTALPFLSEKIDNEIEKTDQEMDKYGGDSRLASAMLDLREVAEKPEYILLGKGRGPDRIAGPDKDVLRNCGDTGIIIEWGAIFTLIYLGFLYYSFLQLARHFKVHWAFAIAFTLVILIFGFSEVYFNLAFFYSLLFFGFIIRRYYPYKQPEITEVDYKELVIS